MALTLRFLGGAGTVTGSKFLVDDGRSRVLVDCGLFQGIKELRLQNWAPFPVEAGSVGAVILTHAHLDHAGYLPLLVARGFAGPVFCTAPTRDLARIILLDSAALQEEDAESANRQGFSKHAPAKPLYTIEEARRALRQLVPIEDESWAEILPGWKLRYRKSGHILGSAFVELEVAGRRIVFSGDVGRAFPFTLAPPATIEEADYLLVESTYGDRLHPTAPPIEQLARVIRETRERGGRLLIPSFAVGRTQDVLFMLSQLRRQGRLPADLPVFLDSPMGTDATEIFLEHPGWHRLTREQALELSRDTTFVRSRQQSEELLRRKHPEIVIAGSGMVSGGRILQHLVERLPDERNTLLLVGYQAAGTRGRLLQDGAAEIKMQGQYHPVRARVETISGLSAHADQAELIGWMRGFKHPPRRTFIVHGEPQASDALRVRIRDKLGWATAIPKPMEVIELS